MTLKETIQADIKDAMRTKEELKRDLLRLLWGEIRKIEIDDKVTLDDDAVIKLIQKTVKQKDESIDGGQKAGRDDIVAKESAEKGILVAYLPQQMSSEELEAVVRTVIEQTHAEGIKDLGKVMKAAQGAIGSRADGKSISETAKRLLA